MQPSFQSHIRKSREIPRRLNGDELAELLELWCLVHCFARACCLQVTGFYSPRSMRNVLQCKTGIPFYDGLKENLGTTQLVTEYFDPF